MTAYDRSYRPPAPLADVTLIHPFTGSTSGTLRGKLDTGADITIIPQALVLQLKLMPHSHAVARGYDGNYTRREVYYVRFKIEEHELPIIRCMAMERETVLVGRNIPNRFFLTLDGFNLVFELKSIR